MRRILRASLFTSAIVTGVLACATLPVCAQMDEIGNYDSAISFDSFHDQLAPYGYWLYSDRWGIVWQPAEVSYDFRPYYTGGHWVYTDDFGWYWLSDYPWGDIPFHYGRWVNDPYDGWLWIPGYIWSPAWVAWRTNNTIIGWMPLPPDDAFLRGDIGVGVSVRFGSLDIGALYSRWYGPSWNERRYAENWVFVPAGFVAAPDFRRVVIRDPVRVVNIIRQTRNVTNYTVVNNMVVNRSVDVRVVERAAGHPIQAVRAATVIRRPNLVARVDVGQRVQMRMREIVPRGRGIANSAPPPPPRVVAKLSPDVSRRNGGTPTHLFTRTTVAAPEVQSRFRGTPVRGTSAEPAGEMRRPNAQGGEPEQPNGPSGSAGSMQGEQQNGPASEGVGRRRPEQPKGPAGPSGSVHNEEPTGQAGQETGRRRPAQNAPGSSTEPNGPAGPGGAMQNEQPNNPTDQRMERRRPEPPNSPGGSAQGEQPNGPAGPGESMQTGQPNAPTGPGAGRRPEQPNGPGTAIHNQQPNGPAGPNGGRARPQQPNGATGPNANPENAQRRKQKSEQQNQPQNPPQ